MRLLQQDEASIYDDNENRFGGEVLALLVLGLLAVGCCTRICGNSRDSGSSNHNNGRRNMAISNPARWIGRSNSSNSDSSHGISL